MLESNGYIFSEKLEKLYNDVQALKPECKIFVNVDDSLIDDVGVDGSQETLINGDIQIISRNNDVTESIISHELLHAYFLRIGYPNHHYVYGNDNPIFHFGRELYNHVIHKLILEEQIKRGFDVSYHQEKLAKNLGVGLEKEFTDPKEIISFSMVILLCDVLCGKYKEIYKEKIEKTFPKSNKVANQLYNAMMKKDYKTAYETREALVRVYKKFDNILKLYKLPNLNLSENVTITYIPRKDDMNRNVLKIFHICKKEKINDKLKFWILISNSDNQSSYIIATEDRTYDEIKSLLKDMTLGKLFEESNCITFIK
ncbi:Uncharacterised protein [Clostridium perfringens]|uniref:Uncharacterized protein n=1 Tax=Clostridium perfringens TaxID=1502 RepID=A0A2X3IQK3_CLOPF|nr:hypothetical protein [Clostridium perfringens]SQC85404.1 Uncharacterised protein [Clostridium perfringens]